MGDFTAWQPPPSQSPVQTLSGILGIQQQRQALQTGQYQQETAQAGATVAQQTAKENQNLAKLIADPVGNGIANPDGTPTDQAKNIYMQAAPTTWATHYDNLVATAQRKVEFNQKVNDLATTERTELANTVAGAASGAQKPQDIKDAITNLVATKQGTPVAGDYARMASLISDQLDHVQQASQGKNPAPVGQEPWRIAALNIGRSVLPASGTVGAGGIGAPQTGTMDVGGSVQPGVVAPAAQGGGFTPSGAPIPKTLAPQVVTYPSGALGVVGGGRGAPSTGAPSNAGGAAPAPRTAAQDAPAPNAPKQVQDAYAAATKEANDHVGSIRNADADYGTNSLIANQIRKLSQNTDTGPGTETWHHVLGALGAPVGANNVADYQLLGAYLDRQAAGARSAMGLPNTNQGTTESKAIAGNTEYQGKALQDKNDLTQSLVEGVHQYREGLDRVAGFSGQASPQAVNQYRSAWTANFDPNVYKGELAYKRSKAEGDAFVKSLSPEEARSLAAKRQALTALSQGQVSQ